MDIRDLMYLEASAAAGNFTRAAKSLRIDTSTISRRVGRFEDELGLALFERGHDGVRLTSGGKAVLPHIRRALAELDAIRHAGDQNGTGIVGEVRLAVRMPPIGEPLRSLLLGWREKYPEVVLTVAEMKRLYCAATTRPRPLWHAARWSRWRRRHQARARWYHKRARLARQHKLAYGVPPGRDSRREALPRFLWLPSAAGEGGRRRRAITLANTGCDDRAAVLSRFVRVTAGVRVAVGQLAASRLGQGISYISSSD